MTIFVDEQIPLLANSLKGVASVTTFLGRELTRNRLIQNNCDILFVRSTTKVNENLLDGTRVKFVGTATSGIDHIDVNYLQSKNIYFADAKGSNANSVAEYVIFSILHWALKNRIVLKELPVGIIGFGNIGSLVAKYCHYLGMRVFINDPPLMENLCYKDNNSLPNYVDYLQINELLNYCKIITNHVPLTKLGKYPTWNLLNRENLIFLQDNTLFIHTSRGGVVVEKDLLEAKKSKNLTLVIDVWENEPNINTELVAECEICTPHVAGYSVEGKLRGTMKMLVEFEKFTNLKPNYADVMAELNYYKPIEIKSFSSPQNIYTQLSNNRKILEDTQEFKKIINLTEIEDRKKYFDYLRKHYPKRRETL